MEILDRKGKNHHNDGTQKKVVRSRRRLDFYYKKESKAPDSRAVSSGESSGYRVRDGVSR
jgi:hypothetical protein